MQLMYEKRLNEKVILALQKLLRREVAIYSSVTPSNVQVIPNSYTVFVNFESANKTYECFYNVCEHLTNKDSLNFKDDIPSDDTFIPIIAYAIFAIGDSRCSGLYDLFLQMIDTYDKKETEKLFDIIIAFCDQFRDNFIINTQKIDVVPNGMSKSAIEQAIENGFLFKKTF